MLISITRVLYLKNSLHLLTLLQNSVSIEISEVSRENIPKECSKQLERNVVSLNQKNYSHLIHENNQSSQRHRECRLPGDKISMTRHAVFTNESCAALDIPTSQQNQNEAEEEENNTINKNSLTPEKKIVLGLALDGASLFIAGNAGTGKSYLLRCIAETLESKGLNVAITASTGIAALGIGGNTFHSTFGVPVVSDDEKERSAVNLSSHIWYEADALKGLDVIIIDEVSLLHAAHIEALDLAARMIPGRSAHKPFGGIQIILSGDFLQLMPGGLWSKRKEDRIFCKGVEKQASSSPTELTEQMKKEEEENKMFVKKGKSYAGEQEQSGDKAALSSVKKRRQFLHRYYDRPVYEGPTFQHCLLHVQLLDPARQREDPEYLNDLNKLRRGILTHRLSRSAVQNPEDPDAIRLFPIKRAVTAFNALKMLELNGEERCFKSELHVASCNGMETSAKTATDGRSKTHTDLLVIHFRNKPMSSTIWRRRVEELILQSCSQCKLNDAVRMMIPPAPSRYSRHLSIYIRFSGMSRGSALGAMTSLRSALRQKFSGKSKEAAVARKYWGTILWDVRKVDFFERFLRSSLERRYAKIIQRDQVLQHKRLKVGCRVMLLRNLNRDYVNGSLGTVVSFQPLRHVQHLIPTKLKVLLSPKQYATLSSRKSRPNQLGTLMSAKTERDISGCNDDGAIVPVVRMDADGKEVAIPWVSLPLPWERRDGFCVVRIVAMPLTPAYAYTVHKVQGLTFDHPVLFDGSGFFPCDHLIYVAASRVKRFSQFRMINVSPRMVSVHREALRFTSAIPPVAEAKKRWIDWKRTQKVSKCQLTEGGDPASSTLLPCLSLFYAEWRLRHSGEAKQK